jgi:hypothetical protein
MLKSYVNAGMPGKSQSSVGISTGIQLPQSGIAILTWVLFLQYVFNFTSGKMAKTISHQRTIFKV